MATALSIFPSMVPFAIYFKLKNPALRIPENSNEFPLVFPSLNKLVFPIARIEPLNIPFLLIKVMIPF